MLTSIFRIAVKTHTFSGLPHGFRRFDQLPSSQLWDKLMAENIKWALIGKTVDTDSGLI